MTILQHDAEAAVYDQHRALIQAQDELKQMLTACRASANTELYERLSAALLEFSAELNRHFLYEENNGFLDPVLERTPNAGSRVQQLLEEHARMRQEISALTAELLQRTDQGAAMEPPLEQVGHLLDELKHHEAAEHELFYDAFWTDGGPGD